MLSRGEYSNITTDGELISYSYFDSIWFSYNFVHNWFVNKDYPSMSLFQGGIIQVKGTFQNTIVDYRHYNESKF